MKRRKLLAAACVFGLALEVGVSYGAPPAPGAAAPAVAAPAAAPGGIPAAQKAMAEKRYDDVDPALSALLGKKIPDPAAVKLSLDAALASGRMVTANQRVNELFKASAGKDLDLLLLSAQTAEAIGDLRNAQLRYLAYARQSTAKTPGLEFSLNYALRREAYPEEYKKYVKLYGADGHAWRVGQAQLAKLIEAVDTDRILDLAVFLTDTFPDAEHVEYVHTTIRNAAEAFVFGKEPKDRYWKPLVALSRHPVTNIRNLDPLWTAGAPTATDEQRIKLTIDLLANVKTRIPRDIISQFGPDLRGLKSPELQAQAAKAFIAAAPIYTAVGPTYTPQDRETHAEYLRELGESPGIFHGKDNPILASDKYAAFVSAYIAKNPEDLGGARERIQWVSQNYLAADPAARAAFLQQQLAVLNGQQLSDLASLSHATNVGDLVTKWGAGKSFRDVLDARVQLLPQYAAAKDKAGILSIAHDYLAAYPTAFNKDTVNQYVIGSILIDAPEKLALLKESIDKAGHGAPMKALIDTMAGNGVWAKDAAFQQLKAAFDQKPAGKDPASATLVALGAIKANPANPDPAVLATAQKFLTDYKGAIPASGEKLTNVEDVLLQQIFDAHAAHIQTNAAGSSAWALLWAPRLGVGTNWDRITNHMRARRAAATLAKLIPLYGAAVTASGLAPDANGPAAVSWRNLWGAAAPAGKPVSPLASVYDLMGKDLASQYCFSQRTAWDSQRQFEADEFAHAIAAKGGKLSDPIIIRALINQQWSLMTGTAGLKIPAESTRALWDAYVADLAAGGAIDLDVEGRTHGIYTSGKKDAEAAEFLASYLQLLQKRTPEQRLLGIASVFRWSNLPADPAGQPEQANSRRSLILKTMKPLYEQIGPRDFDVMVIPGNAILEVGQMAGAIVPTAKGTDPQVAAAVAARKKEALQLGRVWMKMIEAGARNDSPANYWFGIAQANFQDAIAADDPKAITDAVALYGEIISRENITDSTYSTNIAPVLKTLDDRNADESEYAFVAAIQHGKPIDTVARQLMLAKAKSATRIAGLIPVPATDASYDLYVASASLMGGDESKAWELTAPKLNLLKANWEGFDARYVAWAVDQMRKQKLLKESLEFAFNILLRENDLDAETAGHVLLSQSDVYKDMENYQAARLGYEGLKNNNRYSKTEAGQKAVYRLIELHILTKDYTAAETLLERMVDADDVKKQAEAYYLYAEMAFQQAQYKEAKDYLKKVKDRVANHVEASLLEGELNLILPGGLANTEVAIGDPRLSTVVIPGRYLTLQLQDPNLSVARGGAAIPVIVTTSKGGDVEHVKLIPSSANKSLFTARIATALGHAQKDNLTLELIGDDVVSYIIDPDFQKANDLHYPPKVLEVRSDGRLVASSGEILSVEEEEKRELERQLQRREVIESRRLDVGRDGHTIRPGSPIYVQITDPDQDLTDAPDTVKVDLRTTSGEVLEGFSLTETGPHTGVFRGAVPTGIPQPRALASDTDDNRDPNAVIRPVAAGMGEGWLSLSDGHKNKWLEVDTMGSHEVSSITMEIPHLDSVKDLALLGMLADDYDELTSLPARTDGAKGGVQIEVAPLHSGDTIELMRRHLKLAATETFDQEAPVLIRESLPLKDKSDSWQVMHVRGTFWLTENKSMELAYMQPFAGYAERCYVLIDGQIVLNHFNQQTAQVSVRVDLAKGPHTMEILCDENHHNAQVIVGSRQPDGTLAALPSEWFSTKSHPELLEYLRPKGKITVAGDILTATFDKPVRLRKVRAMFRDFTGTAIAVKHVTITDAAGKAVVPVPPEKAAKGVLSIAPGDQVAVTYNDVKRLYGGSKTLGASLNSSYYNGTIALAEEIITANPSNPTEKVTEYLPAKRCRAGDQLMIVVTDYDEDTTDARDTVEVKVTTSSGETLTLKALETYVNHADEWNNHAGQFLAILKFGAVTKGDTIKVAPGDKITVSYLDRENTNPGIPIERTYTVTEAGAEAPRLTVYRTSVKMIPDESPEAKAKLKRIAGRETKGAVLYKPLTVARHPDYVLPVPATQPAAERKEVVASVDAPLLFEVTYPRRALNSGSVLEVTAVAESELQAAAKEKREPVVLKVPTYIQPIDKLAQIKGYPLELKTAMRRDGADMLKSGSFSGVIRLQVGSKGDPIDDLVLNGEFISEAQRLNDPAGLYYKVATLLVSGSDTVHIRVKDESSGKVVDTPIRLLSDARLDLLDPSYMIANEAIHLGEKFHLRVTDADHDTTGERDTVMVKAVSSSGSQAILSLTETLPHSGVFTTTLEPRFIHEVAATQPSTRPSTQVAVATTQPIIPEATLKVDFGDTVTFTYVDDLSLESTSPVTVLKAGKILLGSDAQVASFTKKFKDPEIAVKTRFLMAEALFEMAKEHRKIGEMTQADQEISKGKNILDEAIRDYPNTSLAPQGEYLLANLAQELTNYQEAVGRYATVISNWPDSEYASESQFKQALCFEKMSKYDQAVEEYVKLTYLYPDSPLVADATIRLGNYYLKNESFKTAGKIFSSFQQRNPTHRLAPQALFLAAQCAYKQADYKEAVELFGKTADAYPDEKTLRPEAMYWLADSSAKYNDNVKAFRTFKKVTWDYPESQWAKAARGRLTEEVFSRMQEQEQQ